MTPDALFQLPRSSQLRQLHRFASVVAFNEYGVTPTSIRLMRFEDNAVYSVEAEDQRFSLRLSLHEGRTFDEQLAETSWLAAMTSEGLPVPKPMSNSSGEHVGEVHCPGISSPVTAVLFERISGSLVAPSSPARVAGSLGKTVAAVHESGQRFSGQHSGVQRPSCFTEELFEKGAALTETRAADVLGTEGLRCVARVGERVHSTLDTIDGESGLIHADLHRENLLFRPEPAVIDFDDCAFGHFMLDIATVLSSLGRALCPTQASYDRFTERFLQGYAGVREVPRSLQFFEEFLILREMVSFNFILHSSNPTVGEWGPSAVAGTLGRFESFLEGTPMRGLPSKHLLNSGPSQDVHLQTGL